MFCEKCGKKNNVSAKFCADCGAEMKGASVKEASTEEVGTAPEIDVNKVVNDVANKGKKGLEFAKDFYKKNTTLVLGAGGALLLIIVLLVVFGGNKMVCEGKDDYSETIVEAKYNGDDEVTYLEVKTIMDHTDKDFEDMLDYLDYDDIDEYIEDLKDDAEDEIDDADVDGFNITIKKSGDNVISTMTLKGEALEEYMDDMDFDDVRDVEDYYEDGYDELKCEK